MKLLFKNFKQSNCEYFLWSKEWKKGSQKVDNNCSFPGTVFDFYKSWESEPTNQTKKQNTWSQVWYVHVTCVCGIFICWYLPNISQFEASTFVFAFLYHCGTFYKSIHACTFLNSLKDPSAFLNFLLPIPAVHCSSLLCLFSFFFTPFFLGPVTVICCSPSLCWKGFAN